MITVQHVKEQVKASVIFVLSVSLWQDVLQVLSNSYTLLGSPVSVFLSIEVGSQLTFGTNNGAPHSFIQLSVFYKTQSCKPGQFMSWPSPHFLCLCFRCICWILILLEKSRSRRVVFWKPWISQNRRPFRVLALWWVCTGYSKLYKRLHAWLWQQKKSWSSRGLRSSFCARLCACACVGGNGKQPPQHTGCLMSLAPNWRPDGSI